MSTYLVAFLVGDFQCTAGEQDGVAIRVCATPDKVALTPYGLDVAKYVLHYYNNYFGIPYPLKKLDLIALPDFEAGAMENFGAITYRETDLLIDPKTASIDAKEGSGPGDRPRNGPPVVRRPGHHAVVGQHLAQRGLCHLDGKQAGGRHASGVEHRPDCDGRSGQTL